MSTVNFPEGIKTFKPNDKAPSFIKANLVINKAELINWLSTQPDSVRLDLKESKDGGKLYLAVNDFSPAQKEAMQGEVEDRRRKVITDDSLPF